MKIFAIYLDPKKDIDQAIFVSENFSIFAFILGFFWALYHRLWWIAGIVIALLFCLNQLESRNFISSQIGAVIEFGSFLFLGLAASDLQEKSLSKRGYILSEIVAAKNLDEAKMRYFQRYG